MRKGGGKAKGAGFERHICTQLSLWVTNGKRKDVFWRSAMSGGRATVAKRKGVDLSRQAGDITAIAPEGHPVTDMLYIECKFYRDLQFARFVLHNKGTLAKFWRETRTQAKRYGKLPVLIAKENRGDVLVLTESLVWATNNHVGVLHGGHVHTMLGRFEEFVNQPFDPEWKPKV